MFFSIFLWWTQRTKKLQLFDRSHGLTSWEKCQFCGFLKSMYLLSRKACLLTRRLPNTFSWCILPKTKSWQNLNFFLLKPWSNPFGNMQILHFLETNIFIVQKDVFSISNVKNPFIRIYFHDQLHGDTRGYKGFTRSYRGLLGVTGGYSGWQKNVFLGLFCIKMNVE